LRGTITVATVVLGLLAVIVAAALFFFTALLHRSDQTVDAAIESVHLVDDAQYELLQTSRTFDPAQRASYARALRDELTAAERYVTSGEEGRLLAGAKRDVERYLATLDAPVREPETLEAHLEDASRSLALLAHLNLDQARRADRAVARWDHLGTVLATLVVLLVLVTCALVVWWIRWHAFDPIAQLAATMDRFGQGELAARADLDGATELAAMARRFNAMADRLVGQRERQLTFLAGVAHDLRNPLAALRLRLESVMVAVEEPRTVRALEIAAQHVDRHGRMVDDVLDAARIDAGHLELIREVCDLRRVARTVIDLFASASSIHTLRLSASEQPCWTSCDPMRLEQVLTNLVSNAIKYSPDGGAVDVEVACANGFAYVTVHDEGLGIDDRSMSRIFEPFTRGHRARTDLPGVGLGLSIVKRIIDAHGGVVELVSKPGRGTSATIRLPTIEAPAVSEEAQRQPEQRGGRRADEDRELGGDQQRP
jgi:signal transduction histidine kinase